MKKDIDRLMDEHHVDALFVTGPGQNNPAMVYLTGGIEVSHADLIKKRGENPILFHSPIERDGAVKAGFPLRSYSEFPVKDLLKESGGDPLLTSAIRYRKMFESIGLTSGKVAVYGKTDLGSGYFSLAKLQKYFPEITFDITFKEDIIRQARIIKDDEEIARIKNMAHITVKIVANVADFLTSHSVNRGMLIQSDGSPLTIANVKSFIKLQLLANDVQAEDFIFAIGSEAAVPHNMGNPASTIRLGETIIFDAYFQEMGGGYFYDFTRTWCLGYAPDEVMETYGDVHSVYQKVVNSLSTGTPFSQYQKLTCDLFEDSGYMTLQNQPQTTSGYVHGLGHGIGLEVHESPFAHADNPDWVFKPGMAFTIEPGLYFPEKEFAMRIEDSYYFDADGKLNLFVDYPRDLVLQMAQQVN